MEQLYYCTPDFEVAEFPHRKVIDELRMVMTAFDCVIPDDAGIYCSSDVTTGRRFYDTLTGHQVRSRDELETKLGVAEAKAVVSDVIRKNIERGREFTEQLRQHGNINLINPGPFTAPELEQQHYYYLWEWVIVKKVREAHFNEGWEYSNGCSLEFAISTRKGIPRFDHGGNIIELDQAVSRVEKAVAELRSNGFPTAMLEKNLAALRLLSMENKEQSSLDNAATSLANT